MRLFSRLRSLVRNLFHRAHVEKELDEEVRSYIEMLTDEKVRQGARLEEAHRAAQIELGGIDQVKEKVRTVRSGAGLEELRQDLLYAQHSLVRNAAFAIAAILSLSIGIGSSAVLFCIVKDIFIRPLPFSRPERLIRLTGFYPKGAVAALQRQSTTMDVAAFSTDAEFNLNLKGRREHLQGSAVSSNLFSLLGTQAAVGRTFYPEEDLPGRNHVVVLSHTLWAAGFGANPSVIGTWVPIGGQNRQVIGVMPKNFAFPSSAALLWIPLQMDLSNLEDYWGTGFMPVVARLRSNVSLEQAQEEIRQLIAHVIAEFPYPMARNWNADATLIPLRQDLVGNLRSRSQILLWAVGIVMLLACVNVTSLSLSRASARRKEICIRASLGATPQRIARQILSECLFLAFAGGGLGLLLVFKVIAMLQSALPRDTPRLLEVGIDWPVGLFVLALTVLSGLVSGVIPAISFASLDLGELFKTYGSTLTWRIGNRFRNWLIAGEVTLAFILVISAGLLIRSLWRLTLVDPGFGSEHILTVQVFRDPSSCLNRSACIADYNQLSSPGLPSEWLLHLH